MVQLTIYSKLLILLSVTLLICNKFIICSQGKFEIHIKKYSLFSSLNLSKCCLVSKNSSKSCPESCNIFMEICLSIYQKNPHRYACDIGEEVILTDILGNDTLNEAVRRDYSILVRERWKPNFNILVKIKHRQLSTSEDITILTLSSSEEDVKPSSSWITKQLSTPKDHFQLQVSFRYSCCKDFYGKECDTFCKPSANDRGYYNCSSNGERICHAGYSGSYCDKVVCLQKCIHGTCVGPNQCRCLTGWTGESCNECIQYPGCMHGSCRVDDKTKELLPLTCQCKKKWGGMFCNIDLNYCSNNPNVCENGGECQNFGNIQTNQQYRCICKPGFKGAHCEKTEANCLIRKCFNGGKCEINSMTNQSQCICQGTFYGDRCQFNQTSCDDNPCISSNSLCFPDVKLGFRCKCAIGFAGRNCEIDEDECSTKPCFNGGMCIDRQSGFLCVCPVGFSGDRCQVNKNDCQKLSCMNGAKCMDRANRIDCECTSGWTGRMCDQNINECAINQPCLNNGKCIDTPGHYKCICPLPWSGRLCDLKIMNPSLYPTERKCFINPCRNNGICFLNPATPNENTHSSDFLKSIGGPYTCKCNPGFTGESCEQVIIANGSVLVVKDYQITTNPFVYSQPMNHRPMTLILLIFISIGVPTIIVIIVSFLCCGKCTAYKHSKSSYEKTSKSENIIERTNIKILNNKLHRSQSSPSTNDKIPLSLTKLNNELLNNDRQIPRYKCSHNMNIANLPLYKYQCHIPSLPSHMFSSIKIHSGSQQNANLFSPNTANSAKIDEKDDQFFDKSSLSVRDGEPESQYHKSCSPKSIDNEPFRGSFDFDSYESSNNTSKGFNSAMLCRKGSNPMKSELCSSHNSLLDPAPIQQSLRNQSMN